MSSNVRGSNHVLWRRVCELSGAVTIYFDVEFVKDIPNVRSMCAVVINFIYFYLNSIIVFNDFLLRILKEKGYEQHMKELVTEFQTHADKMGQIASFAAASSTDSQRMIKKNPKNYMQIYCYFIYLSKFERVIVHLKIFSPVRC